MNEMNEQSGNSGQLAPDAGSGGDARAREFLAASLASAGRKKGAEAVLAGELYADTRIALRAIEAALAARQPVGVEPAEYQYRFWIEDRGLWSGWAPIRECDYRRIIETPEEGRQVRALYDVPPAPAAAAVPVDGGKTNLLTWQLHNQLQHLVRAGRYLENRVVETRGAQCMDDFDHELNQAENLLATHPQPAAADRGDA